MSTLTDVIAKCMQKGVSVKMYPLNSAKLMIELCDLEHNSVVMKRMSMCLLSAGRDYVAILINDMLKELTE